VGSFKAHGLGFYDLGGNANEWMLDGFDEKSGRRTSRGGSWNTPAGYSAVAFRNGGDPGYRGRDMGFRVALSSVP
jgi:formylglycine-generating enzyme required for sulfatase activity